MLDWSKSYNAVWRVFRVDESTWADAEQVVGVDSVSVTRSCSGSAPMLESGSMKITADSFQSGYYRIVMNAVQDTESERVNVATLLCESNKSTSDFNAVQHSVTCNSVLYPAYTQRMLDGSYIRAGADVAEYAASLLRKCIKAPVEVESGFTITSYYWFEFGIRILEAVWTALEIGGYVMQIDGSGTVHIRPRPTDAKLSLDGANAALLQTAVSSTFDISDVPNRYIAKSGDFVAIAVNDSEDSPTSTVNRGYIYDEVDDSPATVNNETLANYARRKLAELSTDLSDVRSYKREWWPDVYPYDLVTGSLDTVGIMGDMRVMTQSLTCSYGIEVSEQAVKEVTLWR